MIVYPNAKINIGLSIIEKRQDGFHNIESIFYPILDLCDILEVVISKDDQLEFNSSGINIPGDIESNLCLKAFQLLQADFAISNVKIHLHKNIPIGAGLGGGSADAAFMLKALNELFDLNLSNEQLINYARKLGSDCAFFVENNPVFAFNKGDQFEDINLDLSAYKINIEYPEIHIGTAEAYGGVVPSLAKTSVKKLINQPIDNWKSSIQNDFERSVFPNHSAIKELKEKMYLNGAIYASMTGSGSAVYGIFHK